MKQGLLLFAHGARDPRWAAPFLVTAERVRARAPHAEVRLCFLELMTPSLPEAAQQLVDLGCTRIDVLPMFLGTGGHVRNDLPRLLETLSREHASVEWRLATPIGETDSVIDAMAAVAAKLATLD